jgi:lysophospholipase L1-like esterase
LRSAVNGIVFYDENANGLLDPPESVRLPNVNVAVGTRTGQTIAGGSFTVAEVPHGTQTVAVQPSSLPAYFRAGAGFSIAVPQVGELLAIPVGLPLGAAALPNSYSAFGDSITCGEGSSGSRYRGPLADRLRSYLGRADVTNDCLSGSKSWVGESRIGEVLSTRRPAYVLILYGTNDFNDPGCRRELPCETIDSLRSMIDQARDHGALPILGTVPPVNPAYADKFADERNDWVQRLNSLARAMANEAGVPIAEIHAEFAKQPKLEALFADEKHPNDAGYELIARAFFDAVTRPSVLR